MGETRGGRPGARQVTLCWGNQGPGIPVQGSRASGEGGRWARLAEKVAPADTLRVKRRPNGRRVLQIYRGRCPDVCPLRQRWATVWPLALTLSIGRNV